MLEVTLGERGEIRFGTDFAIQFQRTLRIPDDGKTYPLPPSLGAFPVCRVQDYADRVPAAWAERWGVFIPMYQREAMWMSFRARLGDQKPHAVKVAVGKVNAISGKPWSLDLCASKDDYLVCPPQPWLDGINAGSEYIRQFVAMPLGMGYTVEAQVTGKEEFGGIQIIVYAPKPGRFSEREPEPVRYRFSQATPSAMPAFLRASAAGGSEMGLAAGGRMRQKIYPDPYGLDTWDTENYGRLYVHIINSMMYREITGLEPPATPVTAKTYAEHGLPWFDLYDDHLGDIEAPDDLKKVKSVKEMDETKGFGPQQDDSSVDVPDDKIVKYKIKKDKTIRDGKW